MMSTVSFEGEQLPHNGNYFDLDPTCKDYAGDPLLRLTQNWQDNERKMAEFMTAKAVEIAHAVGAKEINPFLATGITMSHATNPRTFRVARSWPHLLIAVL